MSKNLNILVIDDNEEICEIINILLTKEGFCVYTVNNSTMAMSLVDKSIDLIILDIMMPDKSGFELCKEIRAITMAPIMFLSARFQDEDKTYGLSCGGDDYIIKPFSSKELIARVKALLRRYLIYQGNNQKHRENGVEIGELWFDASKKQLTKKGKDIKLTDIEYRIFELFMKNRQRVLSAKYIYEQIWNEKYLPISNNTVMVHIKNLRKKIENDCENLKYITTVWGKGYRID
ncbi:response regulator transcription factor [Anaerophilus nitritogenes]|uniref:response regulator transcription factor n=1 Tax=Anaerophilus nitritogenes TaxID=2498136 RepID=UPI00101DF497|nr:response regulator transcription factor [Anaerophilus nitritogenes]